MRNRKLPKHQFCPACKRYVKPSTRYPNYFCTRCISLAADKEGRQIEYSNTTIDGHGCAGRYVDTKEPASNICFIKGIECYSEEAYMGGIVIRPLMANKRKGK